MKKASDYSVVKAMLDRQAKSHANLSPASFPPIEYKIDRSLIDSVAIDFIGRRVVFVFTKSGELDWIYDY